MSKLGTLDPVVVPPGAPKPKPFTMKTPEFDETTYYGRFEAFRAMTNPFNAFNSNEVVKMERNILERQKEREAAQFAETGSYEVMMREDEI